MPNDKITVTPIEINESWKINSLHWQSDELIWINFTLFEEGQPKSVAITAFNNKGEKIHQHVYEDYPYSRIFEVDQSGNCSFIVSNVTSNATPYFYQISPKGEVQEHALNRDTFFREALDKHVRPHEIFVKSGDQYWLEVNRQLTIVEPTTQNVLPFDQIRAVNQVYFGQNELIWVATGFGVYRFQLSPNKFSRIIHREEGATIATRNLCLDNDNQLWIVPEGRRTLWNAKLDGSKILQVNRFHYTESPFPLSAPSISLLKGRNGQLYFIPSEELIQLDPKTFEYQQNRIFPKGQDFGFVWTMYEDRYGKIWYGTSKGQIGIWDGNSYQLLPPLDTIKPPKYIYYFFDDQQGQTWLATDGGIFKVDIEKWKNKRTVLVRWERLFLFAF